MEPPQIPDDRPSFDCHSIVDTSRPFRSVKEAVAIFGDRILLPEIHTPKPFSFPKKETPFYSPSTMVEDRDDLHSGDSIPPGFAYSTHDKLSVTVQKLEAELEVTKAELKLLKEKESETEVALASLNAELHKNMSKLALAEAEAMAAKRSTCISDTIKEEEKKRDAYMRLESRGPSQNLAQILSIGEKEALVVEKKRQGKGMTKKKPIIPLVVELFARKKGSSTAALHTNPLHFHLN